MAPEFATLEELKQAIREQNQKYRPSAKWNPNDLHEINTDATSQFFGLRSPKKMLEFPEGIDWQIEHAKSFPVKVFYFWVEYNPENVLQNISMPQLNLSLNSFEVHEAPVAA